MDLSPLHFARVDFRNDGRFFGIKTEDRFSHIYVIGKTGTGKSTLLETMALQDLERGNGFALIERVRSFAKFDADSREKAEAAAIKQFKISAGQRKRLVVQERL